MDNYKALAMAGNRQAQRLWLAFEVAEFEAEKENSFDYWLEFLDICACLEGFQIPITKNTTGRAFSLFDEWFLSGSGNSRITITAVPSLVYAVWVMKQQSKGRKFQSFKHFTQDGMVIIYMRTPLTERELIERSAGLKFFLN